MLSDCAHILRRIGDALRSRGSHYDAVPAALLAMIGESGLSATRVNDTGTDTISAAVVEEDEKSLDEDWMDGPVIFGPEGAPGCKSASPTASVIRFMPRQN
jgi:nitrate reductase delta subunit